MHNIEPHYRWRDEYIAAEDPQSPFFGYQNSEFEYTHRLYNFFLHPQWDAFGSATLYGKLLFVDYEEGYALMELIGEWNDALHNDVMFLKRHVVEPLMDKGVFKFAFFCENVLNFHSSPDDDYYAEWAEEVREEGGWIAALNTRQQVDEEMHDGRLWQHLYFGAEYNDINWRTLKPALVGPMLDALIYGQVKRILG
jgi:hypothetical protein